MRYIDSDLIYHEELLSLEGMHDSTRGEDVAAVLFKMLIQNKLVINNLVSITTDEAQYMIGCKVGLTTLLHKVISHLLSHFTISFIKRHCAKISNDRLLSVMSTVTAIVNLIRAKALIHRQFVGFLQDIECEYCDLLLHSKVRWLSRGKVLVRFIALFVPTHE